MEGQASVFLCVDAWERCVRAVGLDSCFDSTVPLACRAVRGGILC